MANDMTGCGWIAPVKITEQITAPAAEVITAGQHVRFNTVTGEWELGNSSSAAEAAKGGIALNAANVAGVTITVVTDGILAMQDGTGCSIMDPSAFNTKIYVGSADGILANGTNGYATGLDFGYVGRVIPGWGNAWATGTKLFEVREG